MNPNVPGWHGWGSAGKGAPGASRIYLLCLGSEEMRGAGLCLITQQAGALQQDISGKRAPANSSNILMSRGIARVGQSSN